MTIFKESKKSLRWFLIIVGIIGLYSSITGLPQLKGAPFLAGAIFIVWTIMNVITLFIGIKFYSLIQTSSALLIKFFWFDLILTLASAIYLFSVKDGTFLLSLLSAVIPVIVIKNLKRLSKEPAENLDEQSL